MGHYHSQHTLNVIVLGNQYIYGFSSALTTAGLIIIQILTCPLNHCLAVICFMLPLPEFQWAIFLCDIIRNWLPLLGSAASPLMTHHQSCPLSPPSAEWRPVPSGICDVYTRNTACHSLLGKNGGQGVSWNGIKVGKIKKGMFKHHLALLKVDLQLNIKVPFFPPFFNTFGVF